MAATRMFWRDWAALDDIKEAVKYLHQGAAEEIKGSSTVPQKW